MTLEVFFMGGQCMEGDTTAGSTRRMSKKALLLQKQLAQCMRASLAQSLTQRLCRYYFAGRKVFLKPFFLGLSVDCSRLGMKAVMIGMVSLPSSITMWGPPQALLRVCIAVDSIS
jgi:hypothetical protein